MSFRQLFDPASSTYTYLLADDATHVAVLIDPVVEQLDTYLKLLREHGLALHYTLETHVHADHITGAQAIKQALVDQPALQTAVSRDCNAQGFDCYLTDGDVILFGHEEIMVIATPGHTPGSVSYLWRDRLFTGDCLLIGGCGRTDFQGGNAEAQYHSITTRLFALDDNVLVYPGHDYKGRRVSSIGEEKVLNARVAGRSLPEFVTTMNSLGLPAPARIHEAVPANLMGGTVPPAHHAATDIPVLNISTTQLSKFWLPGKRPASMTLLDVRTPAEFAALHVEGAVSRPLDRLDAAGLRATLNAEDTIYCICQTGTRSQFAARELRAAGFRNVIHVDGGTNAWQSAGLPVKRDS